MPETVAPGYVLLTAIACKKGVAAIAGKDTV
jgi:hypothetical protein